MRKSFFAVLIILFLAIFPVAVQAEQPLSMEEMTQKITKLEERVAYLESLLINPLSVEEMDWTKLEKIEKHKIGDIVTTADRTVQLNSVKLKNGLLDFNFTVTNIANKRIEVGGLYSFFAKNSDGVMLESDFEICNPAALDTSLIPDDKVRGSICFFYVAPAPIRIYYQPDWMTEEVLIWEVEK